MNAPLLLAVRDNLVEHGLSVLRFNFRGIGGSEGEAGTGIEEVNDARGALAEMRDRLGELPIAIGGWSFGAAVAVRMADQEQVAACVAIAPSVRKRPGVSVGLPDPAEVSLKAPLLFVCGANDEIVSLEDCRRWVEEAGGDLEVIPAANHFFWAKYDKVASAVTGWLDRVLGSVDGEE